MKKLSTGKLILFGFTAVFLSVGLTLGFAELVLGLMNYPAVETSGWKSEIFMTEWRSPDITEEYTYNQLGYRGRSIQYEPEDFVVLLVGDSQVEATTTQNQSHMPEIFLQEVLQKKCPNKKVHVFSIGCGGYGAGMELLAMRQYFSEYRADHVLLWQTTFNDHWNTTFPCSALPSGGKMKPTFLLKGDQLIEPKVGIGDKVGTFRLGVLLKKALKLDDAAIFEAILPPAYQSKSKTDQPVDYTWQHVYDGPYVSSIEKENLETEKAHLSILLSPASPRMNYSTSLLNRLYQEMKKLCVNHQASFSIFCPELPEYDRDGKYDFRYLMDTKRTATMVLNGKYYDTSSKQYHENVQKMNQGMDFIPTSITMKEYYVSDTDPHLNPQANLEVMEQLAQYLCANAPQLNHGTISDNKMDKIK